MKTADQIAEEIMLYRGEITFSPGQLLTIAQGIAERNLTIKRLETEIAELHDAAFNARCDHD